MERNVRSMDTEQWDMVSHPIAQYAEKSIVHHVDSNDITNEKAVELSAAEVASILGVSRNTVYNLIKSGRLYAEKWGNRYSITNEALNTYLEELKRKRRAGLIATGIILALVILFFVWFLKLLW